VHLYPFTYRLQAWPPEAPPFLVPPTNLLMDFRVLTVDRDSIMDSVTNSLSTGRRPSELSLTQIV
jgi:hypothetical protein